MASVVSLPLLPNFTSLAVQSAAPPCQEGPDGTVCDQTGLAPPLDAPALSKGGYAVTLAAGQTVDADFVNTPLSNFDTRFFDLTGSTDATIACVDAADQSVGSSSTDEDASPETTFESGNVPPGTYTCTITVTDP